MAGGAIAALIQHKLRKKYHVREFKWSNYFGKHKRK